MYTLFCALIGRKENGIMARLQNFSYEVIKNCGIISDTAKQTKELNIIQYGDNEPKYDLRIWVKTPEEETGKKMGKGLTLNEEEIVMLRDILDELDLDEPIPQSKGLTTGGFIPGKFIPGKFF